MAKIIVYTRPDGGVSVVNLSPRAIAETFGGSEEAALSGAQVNRKIVPPGSTDVTVINAVTVPNDRWFRDAWFNTAGAIDVDLPKAREIQAARISHALGLEIARLKLSEQQARLAGRPNDATADAATRTALEVLDLTVLETQIGAAANASGLKAVWPAQVPKP